MQSKFWDERFASEKFLYGEGPNEFFRNFLKDRSPGALLLPAEGQGRNALYAASLGWEVDAFDFSEVARENTLQRASQLGLKVNYYLQDIAQFTANKQYDVVGLFYVHLPETVRKSFHQQIVKSLNPGGILVLEAFSKEQLGKTSGGPQELSLLYHVNDLKEDFSFLNIVQSSQNEEVLHEGKFHEGPASLVRFVGCNTE